MRRNQEVLSRAVNRTLRPRHDRRTRTLQAGLALFAILLLGEPQLTAADDLDAALAQLIRMNEAAAQSQGQIDTLDEQTSALLAEYRMLQQRIESMTQYEAQVKELVEAQRTQLATLRGRIDEATNVNRQITPLMNRMLEVLAQFVELDVPFLLPERHERIANLREMMKRADVSEAEKFRRILEGYQIENDYGRTIEAYRGKLALPGQPGEATVIFLRVGRVALVYQSLDAKQYGVWNQLERKWTGLPEEARASITKGIRMAQKQTAPDLVLLPLPGPEDAR